MSSPDTRSHGRSSRSRSVLAALVAAIALLAGGTLLAGPKITKQQRERLDAGDVLVKAREVGEHKATLARAIGVIDAPPAKVWPHIDQCGKFAEFLPRMTESEELSRDGEIVYCRSVVDLPFPLGSLESEMKCRHRDLGKGRFERRWKGVKGPYHVNEGSWNLEPWGEGGQKTLLVYVIKVAPKSKIPSTIRREAQKMTLPKVVQAVRDRVKTTK